MSDERARDERERRRQRGERAHQSHGVAPCSVFIDNRAPTTEKAPDPLARARVMSAPEDGGSARIADRLLRGWTLTAEHCPVASCRCPLMLEPGAGDAYYCARADASVGLYDREHGARDRGGIIADDASVASDGKDDEQRRVRAMTADAAVTAANPSKNVDVSSRVADKLLEGWVLTRDSCPMPGCATPLVRDRAGEVFCVRHELFVRASSPAAAPQPPPGTAAAAAGSADASRDTARTVRDAIDESSVRTLRALEGKLESARAALEAETNAHKCREWLAFIDDVHASMRALRGA